MFQTIEVPNSEIQTTYLVSTVFTRDIARMMSKASRKFHNRVLWNFVSSVEPDDRDEFCRQLPEVVELLAEKRININDVAIMYEVHNGETIRY